MAVSTARPVTPLLMSSSSSSASSSSISIPIEPQGSPAAAIWLVHVSTSKDLSTAAVTKALEEYSRVPKDGSSPPVIIRLEFVMSTVPSPIGTLQVSRTTKTVAAAYALEVQHKYLEPMARLLQQRKLKAEMHVTKKDNEADGLILAAKKARAERLYFPVKRSLFSKEIPLPPWVVQLPPSCELIVVQGSKVVREMGGSAEGLDDLVSELGLSDREDSFRLTPRSASLGSRNAFGSSSHGSIEIDPRSESADSATFSATFSIDAASGTLTLDPDCDVPRGRVRRVSASGPLPPK